MAINYNPTTWVDNTTPVNAQYLNNIEQGIANATTQINTNTNNIATNTSTINQHSADIAEIQQEISGGTVDEKYINFMMGKPSNISSPYGENSSFKGNLIQNFISLPNPTTGTNTYTYTLWSETLSGEKTKGYLESIYIPNFTMPAKSSGVAMARIIVSCDGKTALEQSLWVGITSSSSSATSNCTLGIVYPYAFTTLTSNYQVLAYQVLAQLQQNQGLEPVRIPSTQSAFSVLEYFPNNNKSDVSLNFIQGTAGTNTVIGLLNNPFEFSQNITVRLIFTNVASQPTIPTLQGIRRYTIS